MRKRGKKSRPLRKFLFFIFFVTIFGFLTISSIGQREFSAPHKIIFEILGTAQTGVTGLRNLGVNTWQHYVALWNVRTENLQLRLEIKKYQEMNSKYQEALATNLRLNSLLDLKESLPAPTLTAQVIGRDPSQWFKTLTINRGTSSGVTRGMPVVTVEGVVGQIFDGANHYAKVIQAIDPNSAIDVLVQRSRTQGILKGTGSTYKLQYVVKNSDVRVGDTVITSGLSGTFPKAIPVGTVSSVVSNRRGMFLEIDITPAVDFNRLENVVIVMTPNKLAE
ncbi:MAG: rod shape-determining protein MreC [Proteobacteria bacterium]|nr:rod shape-determining protein MreC [Pseudomonadota bacterium]MBU1686000.1 rod shape-determining protein MreC [Pseudomonadota bacterium]